MANMKSLHPFYASIALAVASLIGPTPLLATHEAGPNTMQSSTAESYPNTADGLRLLLNDLLLAAKNDDQTKLSSLIAQIEIPNYEKWFTLTFGQERGEGLANMYGRSLKASDLQFELLWTELVKQEGEISVEKVDTGTLPGPLDEYKANWKKTDTSRGPDRQSIGIFYFVDGKFRLNGSFHDVRILSPSNGGVVVAGKLLNRIEPVYPELARMARIQGTVAVNVIVLKDGTVTVQNVAAAHPLLAQAAVAAVQQWRYQPTTINGEPVDV
jgi:TonB family protein